MTTSNTKFVLSKEYAVLGKLCYILKCKVQQIIRDKMLTQHTSSIHYGCYIPVSNINCRLANGKQNCTAKLFSRNCEIFKQGTTISLS